MLLCGQGCFYFTACFCNDACCPVGHVSISYFIIPTSCNHQLPYKTLNFRVYPQVVLIERTAKQRYMLSRSSLRIPYPLVCRLTVVRIELPLQLNWRINKHSVLILSRFNVLLTLKRSMMNRQIFKSAFNKGRGEGKHLCNLVFLSLFSFWE